MRFTLTTHNPFIFFLTMPSTFAEQALIPLHIEHMNAWYFDYQGTEIRLNAEGFIA